MEFNTDRKSAEKLDAADKLREFRSEFHFPQKADGKDVLYFCGHSLGLQPKKAKDYINSELDQWKNHGVEGHFVGKYPWMPYHEFVTEPMAKLVGAESSEVVVMNSLTANLHLLFASFYRPEGKRNKILVEADAFPSDHYAVDSQVAFHKLNPAENVVKLAADQPAKCLDPQTILSKIEELGDELALVWLGNVNYLTGQYFDIAEITRAAHKVGAKVGYDLAHGAGNIELFLHDHQVDFAVWCNYKYLNGGPGTIGSAFVHEKYHKDTSLPRLAGWWGHNKQTRFEMPSKFVPIKSAEAWQLSNPPIFQLAALRASLEIFDNASMSVLAKKGRDLSAYLEFLLKENCKVEIISPEERGTGLSLRVSNQGKHFEKEMSEAGLICDFRYPNILRLAPVPLYTRYVDVYDAVEILKGKLNAP